MAWSLTIHVRISAYTCSTVWVDCWRRRDVECYWCKRRYVTGFPCVCRHLGWNCCCWQYSTVGQRSSDILFIPSSEYSSHVIRGNVSNFVPGFEDSSVCYCLVYLMMPEASDCIETSGTNNELGSMWNGAAVSQFEVPFRNFSVQGLWEFTQILRTAPLLT
jgi:hypothetical protein